MVKHTLKILQHLLQDFESLSDHFGTLCIRRSTIVSLDPKYFSWYTSKSRSQCVSILHHIKFHIIHLRKYTILIGIEWKSVISMLLRLPCCCIHQAWFIYIFSEFCLNINERKILNINTKYTSFHSTPI